MPWPTDCDLASVHAKPWDGTFEDLNAYFSGPPIGMPGPTEQPSHVPFWRDRGDQEVISESSRPIRNTRLGTVQFDPGGSRRVDSPHDR